MSDISSWYKNVPKFTKYWLTLTVGISLAARFGILNDTYLYLIPNKVFKNFQIWRLLTSLFHYPITPNTGFHFMLNCYFLYNYSLRLETDHYKSSPADYFFLLIFNWLCCVIIGLIINIPALMDPMVLSVLYVWCQLNRDVIVNFWFGTRFKAMYLPWVLFLVNVILSSGFFSLLGILIGHLYFFLKFKYPQELGGATLLETPMFLKRYFPGISGGVHGFGIPPASAQQRPPTLGRNWGQGQALGRD